VAGEGASREAREATDGGIAIAVAAYRRCADHLGPRHRGANGAAGLPQSNPACLASRDAPERRIGDCWPLGTRTEAPAAPHPWGGWPPSGTPHGLPRRFGEGVRQGRPLARLQRTWRLVNILGPNARPQDPQLVNTTGRTPVPRSQLHHNGPPRGPPCRLPCRLGVRVCSDYKHLVIARLWTTEGPP
jgi:hypothetical protein